MVSLLEMGIVVVVPVSRRRLMRYGAISQQDAHQASQCGGNYERH
jgi:hypothetical protein